MRGPRPFADPARLIVVPPHEDGLRKTVANAPRRYAASVNARNK